MAMIDLRHVSKTFRKGNELVDAVRDISLTIAQKEIVAIIGPSGCGKSTLLNMVAGLYPPSSGSIIYKSTHVSDVNTDVGYMTQKDNLLPWRTVRDNIAFPLELAGVAKPERADRADQVIKHVGLDGFAHRFPHELSGGMRKRACLARMLLYGAETALLDEPFAALDAQLKLAMHDLLLKLAAETGQTVVLVTHEPRAGLHAPSSHIGTRAAHRPQATARCAQCPLHSRVQGALRRALGASARRISRGTGMTAPDVDAVTTDLRDNSSPRFGSGFMVICQVVLGLVFLLLWQGASGRLVDSFFISNPLEVGTRLMEWIADGSLFLHIWSTVYATVMGFLVGSVGGLILGIWLGVSPFTSRLLNPYLNALNALPKVALAPLFVLWFGLGIESKVALAAVLVLFLVFLNTYAGVREVDQDLIDGARLMKATRTQVITKVIVPSAMSWVFAGLKISVPYALIGAVLGEMIAANRGLGYLVQFSGSQFDSAGVFAVLIVIALLAVALNFLVEIVQHRMEQWRVVGR